MLRDLRLSCMLARGEGVARPESELHCRSRIAQYALY